MKNVLNMIEINENICTSGQPSISELNEIANEGYEVVINLALCDASNALSNEDKIVTDLGMTYVHLPVDFEKPKKEDLDLFVNILYGLNSKKVWVHCALNYRVTAFMYVYHKYVLQTPFEEINLSLLEKWCPDEIWQNIMKTELN